VLALAVGVVAAGACGGKVVFVEDDGAGGSGTTGTSKATGGTTKGTTASAPSTMTTPFVCENLSFGECVTAPGCAPIFDDACCPVCSPGTCGDCVNWEFIGCMDRGVACKGEFDCGFVGEYICQGVTPNCNGFCEGTMGCEPAICASSPCPGCQAIVPNVCTAVCDVPPPPCPPGFVAASDGVCWTGMCIDQFICGGPIK
jgi:hypothetical protein